MMLTRCPACQTVFRLRPEQLHARGGEVRCGHCFHPFNALENTVEVRDDGQITIRVGNDPNNLGVNELGRVNAGSAPWNP